MENKKSKSKKKKSKSKKKEISLTKRFTWWDWWELGAEGRSGIHDDYAGLTSSTHY